MAGGRDDLKAMRAVSKTWQEGYEISVTKIRIAKQGPVLSAGGSFASRFPLLTSLHLEYCILNNPGLQNLKGLNRLVDLSLRDPSNISDLQTSLVSDEHLFYLRKMKLTNLDLTGCSCVDIVGLRYLRRMPLTRLILRDCRYLDKASLECLRGLPLAVLDLAFCNQVTNEGLRVLQGMPISDLNLWGWFQLSGEGLRNLRGLPLSKLNLGGCHGLRDNDLSHLRGLPLSKLWLCQCDLQGVGLVHLKGLPLKNISLEHCMKFKPENLEHLQGLPLEILNLSFGNMQVTKEDLLVMVALPLKKLYLKEYGVLRSDLNGDPQFEFIREVADWELETAEW